MARAKRFTKVVGMDDHGKVKEVGKRDEWSGGYKENVITAAIGRKIGGAVWKAADGIARKRGL